MIEIGDQLYHTNDRIGGYAHNRFAAKKEGISSSLIATFAPETSGRWRSTSTATLANLPLESISVAGSSLIKRPASSTIRSRDSRIHNKTGDKSDNRIQMIAEKRASGESQGVKRVLNANLLHAIKIKIC